MSGAAKANTRPIRGNDDRLKNAVLGTAERSEAMKAGKWFFAARSVVEALRQGRSVAIVAASPQEGERMLSMVRRYASPAELARLSINPIETTHTLGELPPSPEKP